MKIICPEHLDLIYVDLSFFDTSNVVIKQIVECPVCDELVLIDGVYDFDAQGVGSRIDEEMHVKSLI